MPFFTYSQNNSGGFFTEPADYVIVEADSATEADAIFQTIDGCYFDDSYERDCDCCGTRWSQAWDEGDPVPMIYGVPVEGSTYDSPYMGVQSVLTVRKGEPR